MASELTLFFSDETGLEQAIPVKTNPFTIGRQEGNELVVPDSSLSRRHALITFFRDVATITDCGSQNGTFLNGRQVSGNAELKNGDVITLGQNCRLRVQLTEIKHAVVPKVAPVKPTVAPKPEPASPSTPAPTTNNNSLQFSPMLMAIAATGAILLIAGVLIVVVVVRKPKPSVNSGEIVFTQNPATPAPTESGTSTPTTTTSTTGAGDQLETSLKQAIRSISNDSSYPFTPAVLEDIKRKTAQFATPTLANTLRTISSRGKEVADQIRGEGLKPALLFYLALAETNGGQSGDVLAIARQAVPSVQFLRAHFGSNFADQTLLVVAAYKIPGGSKKSHPLLPVLNKLVRNPQTDRNVWFLREKGALSDTSYDFVLRFLAYGAIAQNPRQFSLDAPALIY